MGSSPTKILKKVVKPVKKIISSPIGQIGLALAMGPAGFGAGAAGGKGLASFMSQAARRAAINAAIQKASGQDVDLKSALISGGVGAGIGQLAPTYLPETITKNPFLMDAATGALTNVATSAATGQRIDPKAALMAGALSGGIGSLERGFLDSRGGQPLFGQRDTGTDQMADVDLIEQQMQQRDPSLTAGMEMTPSELTPSVSPESVGEIYSGAFAGEEYDMPGGAVGMEPITGKMGQTTGIRFTDPATGATSVTKGDFGDIPLRQRAGRFTEKVKEIFSPEVSLSDRMKSSLSALKELSGAAIDRPYMSIGALSALAGAAAVPQQPDESDEAYQQRLSEVEQYVRRYGANLNLPQSQINQILSNVRAESSSQVRLGAAMGGIMDVPVRQNSMGVQELDYRQEGGFVPVGEKEKADDVPAMLSKNEFVMTADAVRGAGNGDIERGAQRMYDTMKRLESKIA